MKNKINAFLTLILINFILQSCIFKPEMVYKTISGPTQGTAYNIKYEDQKNRELKSYIEQLLSEFDLSLSSYIPQSVISRINRNEKDVEPDNYFITAFNKSKEIYKLSEGAFDITVAPLVNAWGFGPGAKTNVDSAGIDSIMQFVGMDKIDLINNKIVKKNPLVQMDVNAIAQGYSVDIVCDFLEKKGVKNYMVEIGGELKVKGVNDKGKLWSIGIDKPIDGNTVPGQNLQAFLRLDNKAISTSGNYRAFHVVDGVKYSHTINPKTGYPISSRLLSATVMTPDCMTADAMATCFMVIGLDRSMELLSRHPEIDAYLIYSDDSGNFKSYMTEGYKGTHLQEIE